jgi:hypothetical protein
MDDRDSIPGIVWDFSPRYHVQTISGAHQASYDWAPDVLSPGVKRPEPEADEFSPTSSEFKNACSYTSIPPISLDGVVLN